MDEWTLAVSSCVGNVADFNRLVETHQDMAYNVAYRTLGQADGAVKATAEAFRAAYRALPAYRGGSFQVWLLRIVIRACHKYLSRRRDGTATLPEHAEGQGTESTIAQLIGTGICRLPWEQRVTLVLADVQGLSYEQVAQVTGVSVNTVGLRLGRARVQLACHLQEAPVTIRAVAGGRSQRGEGP